jgi:hypothetical protein
LLGNENCAATAAADDDVDVDGNLNSFEPVIPLPSLSPRFCVHSQSAFTSQSSIDKSLVPRMTPQKSATVIYEPTRELFNIFVSTNKHKM